MSKRNYTHMNEYEAVILTMRQSGYTRREIADEFPCMVNLLISVKEYLHPADKHTCGKFGGFEQKIRPDMRTWGRLKRGMMAEIESFGGKWWVWLPETSGDVT